MHPANNAKTSLIIVNCFPSNITAFTTTIANGNLATHTQLDAQQALRQRQQLNQTFNLPKPQTWLEQTHSTNIVQLPCQEVQPTADAAYTQQPLTPCVVMTADCLPLLLSNRHGTEVAAVHAGWRGLRDGIIQKTVQQMHSNPNDIIAYLGPAISSTHLQLNQTIYDHFVAINPLYQDGFIRKGDSIYGDLYQLARIALHEVKVNQCFGGDYCTFTDEPLFYSYRRQGEQAGRMASMIFIS